VEIVEYCPYCGSHSLVENNNFDEKLRKSMGMEGKVSINIAEAKFGKEGDIYRKTNTFSNLYCITCKKIKRLRSPTFPLHYISLYPKRLICVLPSALLEVIKYFNYNEFDIHNLIVNKKEDFYNFYRQYQRTNTNPIKNDIIGFECNIHFKDTQENISEDVCCWIIVDLIEDGLGSRQVLRMSHQIGAA